MQQNSINRSCPIDIYNQQYVTFKINHLFQHKSTYSRDSLYWPHKVHHRRGFYFFIASRRLKSPLVIIPFAKRKLGGLNQLGHIHFSTKRKNEQNYYLLTSRIEGLNSEANKLAPIINYNKQYNEELWQIYN